MRIAHWIPIVAALTGVCASGIASGADMANAQEKAKICQACHGLDGNSSTPDYPKLGGQYPDYLAKALRDYKGGLRKNVIMAGMTAPLTTKDIDDLAAYYASQPSVLDSRY